MSQSKLKRGSSSITALLTSSTSSSSSSSLSSSSSTPAIKKSKQENEKEDKLVILSAKQVSFVVKLIDGICDEKVSMQKYVIDLPKQSEIKIKLNELLTTLKSTMTYDDLLIEDVGVKDVVDKEVESNDTSLENTKKCVDVVLEKEHIETLKNLFDNLISNFDDKLEELVDIHYASTDISDINLVFGLLGVKYRIPNEDDDEEDEDEDDEKEQYDRKKYNITELGPELAGEMLEVVDGAFNDNALNEYFEDEEDERTIVWRKLCKFLMNVRDGQSFSINNYFAPKPPIIKKIMQVLSINQPPIVID